MKFTKSLLIGVAAPLASAFPAAVLENALQDDSLVARANEVYDKLLSERQHTPDANAAQKIFEPVPVFNAKTQYIDTTDSGPNPWKAPGPNDLRGPCPGLNAFANHGFLPRNGYATITQFIDATTEVVGMGPLLAAFLAVLGASIDGSGTAWSIGGTPGFGNALDRQGHGISGSHNKYESDASPTRPDLYQTGNDYMTQADQFNEMIKYSPDGYVDINSLTNFRSARFDHQMATNPYFFNGPFTGVLVQPAAYTFIFRFMANHSEEHKTGYLSYDTISSWFGMEKASNGEYQLKNGKQGQERIPLNWYRRPQIYPYTNQYFLGDVANALALHPKFADIGGNTGKPNTFTGVDVANLTNGAYNAQTLAQGDNLFCLAYQFSAQVKPDVAVGALTNLAGKINPLLADMGCPQLKKIDDQQLMDFPGYKRSGVAPSS